jgi:hypothetical protein
MNGRIFALVSLLTLATGCAGSVAAPLQGLTYEGLPIEETEVTQIINDFTAFAKANVTGAVVDSIEGKIDFRAFSDFKNCSINNPNECPRTYHTNEGVDIIVDWQGLRSIHNSSLIHELAHALYGDHDHTRKEIWGNMGLVVAFNEKLEFSGK